jgi:hypothetical protein
MIPARTRFLQRRSYRQRRIADAARILPVAGAILLLLPLLRLAGGDAESAGEAAGAAARTSQVGIYIFAVWVGLIAIALLLSRRLVASADNDPDDARAAARDARRAARTRPEDAPKRREPGA